MITLNEYVQLAIPSPFPRSYGSFIDLSKSTVDKIRAFSLYFFSTDGPVASFLRSPRTKYVASMFVFVVLEYAVYWIVSNLVYNLIRNHVYNNSQSDRICAYMSNYFLELLHKNAADVEIIRKVMNAYPSTLQQERESLRSQGLLR